MTIFLVNASRSLNALRRTYLYAADVVRSRCMQSVYQLCQTATELGADCLAMLLRRCHLQSKWLLQLNIFSL